MTTRPDYFHVLGHMDDYLADDLLTLEQRLNKRCDILAKLAIDEWLRRKRMGLERTGKQLFPCETAALLIGGQKITGDIADAIRFAKGMEYAKKFLVEEQGWSEEQFEEVEWKILHRVLKNKPYGFKTWLSKQFSGCCGTAVQVGYYSGRRILTWAVPIVAPGRMPAIFACARVRSVLDCLTRTLWSWKLGCTRMAKQNRSWPTG